MSQSNAVVANDTDRPAEFEAVSDALMSLSRALGCPPDTKQVQSFSDMVDTLGMDAPGCARMVAYFEQCEGRPMDETVQELGIDWTLAFRGVNPAEGPRPPYAGAWLAEDGVGVEVMMEVNSHYVARGLGHGSERLNRLDYLAAEVEFVARLIAECAQVGAANEAGAAGAAEQRQALAVEIVEFEDEYLLSWLPRYRAAVEETCKTEFWKGYLELLEAFLRDIRDECAALSDLPREE